MDYTRKEAINIVLNRNKKKKSMGNTYKGGRKKIKTTDLNFQSGKLDPEYKSIGGKVFKGR